MNFKEKSLYHQIHSVKLATDISTSIISFLFFWGRQIYLGLLTGTIPSVIASVLIIRYVNLEKVVHRTVRQEIHYEVLASLEISQTDHRMDWRVVSITLDCCVGFLVHYFCVDTGQGPTGR